MNGCHHKTYSKTYLLPRPRPQHPRTYHGLPTNPLPNRPHERGDVGAREAREGYRDRYPTGRTPYVSPVINEESRHARQSHERELDEIRRQMEAIDSVITDGYVSAMWHPPSIQDMLVIDPVYSMGPEVPLFPLVSYDNPTYEMVSCANRDIWAYNERRLARIVEVDGRKMILVMKEAGLMADGILALRTNGFDGPNKMIIHQERLDDVIKAYNRSVAFPKLIPAKVNTSLFAFIRWGIEQIARHKPLDVKFYRANKLQQHYMVRNQQIAMIN
jgi:hypothetical protein